MDNNGVVFGYDIGITSIGSAIVNGNNNLDYLGVRIFNQATEAKESRLHRSARRNLARKKWRKRQLKEAFVSFGLVSAEEIEKKYYGVFTSSSPEFEKINDKTVYHLRKRALKEKVSERELYLCFLNMLHARGHFNMEMYDFSKGTITFEDFIARFYENVSQYFEITDKQLFEEKILKGLFNGKIDQSTIKSISTYNFVEEEKEKALIEVIKLLNGNKAKLTVIDEKLSEDDKSTNIMELRNKTDGDELDEFLIKIIDLFDMIKISNCMKSYDYLCEMAVDKADKFEKMIAQKGTSKEAEDYFKELKGKSNSKTNRTRAIRNIENNFPNGLYVKEARDILNKQKDYNSKITTDFIEAVLSIISARIPYYIGPLNNEGKNAWVSKSDEKAKYSYDYMKKQSLNTYVNEQKSIAEWKNRMRSKCTYLPNEYALPKGSFIGETYTLLNEINILTAYDKNGDQYYLTQKDKCKLFDELFLNKNKPALFEEISKCLNLESFGTKPGSLNSKKMNNCYTLYSSIAKIVPELRVTRIMELFDEIEKIQKIEDIILALNLYDEEISKKEYFERDMGFDEATATSLSKLNSNSSYSFSKEFIFNQVINDDGDSIMSQLFKDNRKGYKNEQMTIISNATDGNGKHVNFSANKYEKLLIANGGKLDINLLMNDGKPVIPMSRPVVRALNECMKVYEQQIKYYGVPSRIIIETARDFKDFTENKTVPEKRFKNAENLYNHLKAQIKENKIYENKEIEDWENLASHFEKNKLKIELYIRQNGMDLLTGKLIDINKLYDYEVDHILPRGFGDDSQDDKMLISKLSNAKKADRLPLQFLASTDAIEAGYSTSSEYLNRVRQLYEAGLISEKKYQRLTLETTDDLDGFINQNLVDTRYIIREFMSILRAYNNYHGYDTHIVAMKSAYTNIYRKAFGMDKNRNFGDQHHAHDAAMLIVADKTLSYLYPHYDQRKPFEKGSDNPFATYNGFIQSISNSKKDDGKEEEKTLSYFIKNAYSKTFGGPSNLENSLISQIKNYVPFYSVKVEKNYHGQFFEATIIPQKNKNEDSPLSIIGVNNDKHIFSGVECVAVDFFKAPNKKGEKENIAIHIPKVIVSKDGKIDKEKYIKLIKEYYKKPQLIDEDGNIKEFYYRFRAFRNDIIYDTVANQPTLFNIGSMADKRLEKKFINVFSYNEIYKRGEYFVKKLIDVFNIKTKTNKEGVLFSTIDKSSLVTYCVNNLWNCKLQDRHIESIIKSKEIANSKNIYDLCNALSFYELLTNRPDYPPTITGQYRIVANPSYISASPDAEYIKLKYNILGLRFDGIKGEKLQIESPIKLSGSFSKIRKEKFRWTISKEML